MRLISYNIHKGVGGWDLRYRLERILAVVEAEAPDLMCFQEVTFASPRTRYHDQPRLLAERLKAAASFFQLNVRWRVGGYGNLILSRWPFLLARSISLQYRSRKVRAAQAVVVDTPEGPLHLVNWHLGLAEKERHWQAAHLLAHPLFAESVHLPTLIVGDCNDWRDTLAPGPLAHHAFEQITAPARRFRSFPSLPAVLALDKAFCRGPVIVRDARIVRSREARWASDHLPLVIDFHLAGPATQPRAGG